MCLEQTEGECNATVTDTRSTLKNSSRIELQEPEESTIPLPVQEFSSATSIDTFSNLPAQHALQVIENQGKPNHSERVHRHNARSFLLIPIYEPLKFVIESFFLELEHTAKRTRN